MFTVHAELENFTSKSFVIGCVAPWVTIRMAYALQIILCPTSISPACQWFTPALMAAIPRAALLVLYSFLSEDRRLTGVSIHLHYTDGLVSILLQYSHVSFHHFTGIVSSFFKVLQVRLYLTEYTPHSQQVDVSVGQHWLCLLNALCAEFYHLKPVDRIIIIKKVFVKNKWENSCLVTWVTAVTQYNTSW